VGASAQGETLARRRSCERILRHIELEKNSDSMGFYSDLMGFYSDSMGY